ncbi:flippase-like domain-containing protein [Luminiphilus sp.]|nr:flippase-like domain-containing protein [Luminiphilus sp.]
MTASTSAKTNVLKLVLFGAAIWFLSTRISLDISLIRKAVSREMSVAILAVQPLLLAATLANALRHSLIISYPRARFRPCLSAILLSAGLNLVIPGRVTEIVKATYLQKQLSIPLSNGTAAIVIERLLDLCVVSAIGFLGVFGVYLSNSQPILLAFTLTTVGLVFLRPLSIYLLPRLQTKTGRIVNFLRGNFQHVAKMMTWRLHLSALLLTVLSWSIHFFAIWLFFLLLPSYSLSLAEAALVFGAIIFAGALPGLPGGIGAIQAAVTFSLIQIGIPLEQALVLSFALHASEILICATCAPFILFTQPTGIGDLLRNPASRGESEQTS